MFFLCDAENIRQPHPNQIQPRGALPSGGALLLRHTRVSYAILQYFIRIYILSYDVFCPTLVLQYISFVLCSILCGLLGAMFVYTHRSIVVFLRTNKFAKKILTKSPIVYPIVVVVVTSLFTLPDGLGIYIGAKVCYHTLLVFGH